MSESGGGVLALENEDEEMTYDQERLIGRFRDIAKTCRGRVEGLTGGANETI
jgi:hypothetical protein